MTLTANKSGYYRDGIQIDINEYEKILSIIKSKPTAPKGKDYRLTDNLTWEIYDLPLVEFDELTDEELGRMVREGMM